jgi:hypothetical protein
MNYFIAALKRSGQHGVINWLAQQIPADVLHLNNCITGWDKKRLDPMAFGMAVRYLWDDAEKCHVVKNFCMDWKIDIVLSRKLQQEFAHADFSNIKNCIYNIEDFDLEVWNINQFNSFKQLQPHKKIVIIRDPYNFVASCLQRRIDPPDAGATDVADQLAERMLLWKQHAHAALDEESGYYAIKFNDWFASKEYRQQICDDLGLLFTDNGLNDVLSFGSGSSFDREKYDENAQKMKVLERWKQYPDQEKLASYIDDEAKDLCNQLFGEIN